MNNVETIDVISDFIHLRISQKNSLSNLNQNNTENPKGIEKTFIHELIKQLDNHLTEGHTIYFINKKDNKEIIYNIKKMLELNLLTLDNENNDIKTPIVVKNIANGWIFWFQRQWFVEKQLASQILKITQTPVNHLSELKNDLNVPYTPNAQQQEAIDKASRFAFSIITGGPGTGKTFTVAQLVIKLKQMDKNIAIALTAPTGKASQRMQESLNKILQSNQINLDNAKTLHRLLGIGQDGLPHYHANNPLPDDLVIVDEASMLGLELAYLLVNAIKPNGRLVLLGDANQLSAVDAGSVLSDLCKVPKLAMYRTRLTESKRFKDTSKVGKIALILQQAIFDEKTAHIDDCLMSITPSQFFKNPTYQDKIIWFKTYQSPIYQALAWHYYPFFDLIKQWYKVPVDIYLLENRQRLFATFDRYRVLSAGNHGKIGTNILNERICDAFFHYTKIERKSSYFFHGLPVMINRNDYHLGLFNGDIGICLAMNGELVVCFMDKVIGVSRLSMDLCDMAYSMSIHKSQGSEFDCVAVCLDKTHGRLLSQELIYTAITRSKNDLLIVSDKVTLDKALSEKTVRYTGLREFF